LDTLWENSNQQFIYLLFGNEIAEIKSDGRDVFTESNGYQAVWHLHQDPLGKIPQMKDASDHANHATAHKLTAKSRIEGVVWQGLELNGTNQYITTQKFFSPPNFYAIGENDAGIRILFCPSVKIGMIFPSYFLSPFRTFSTLTFITQPSGAVASPLWLTNTPVAIKLEAVTTL